MKIALTLATLGTSLVALGAHAEDTQPNANAVEAPIQGETPPGLLPTSKGDALDLSNAASTHLDIAYASESETQKIDIYIPESDGPLPVIFAIHGGGFKIGSKDGADTHVIIRSGLEHGYAVVSVGYRLSGEATFPAAVDDVFAAIKFVRQNADDYDLDANRFAAWGASAGGHFAAMAATRGDAEAETHIHAAVDWYGPILFNEMDAQFAVFGKEPLFGPTGSPGSPESEYLGVAVGDDSATELVLAASPQSYISENDPPIFIQHGTADPLIPLAQSQEFANALSSVIGDDNVYFEALEGAGHGGPEFESEENVAKVYDFLSDHLE